MRHLLAPGCSFSLGRSLLAYSFSFVRSRLFVPSCSFSPVRSFSLVRSRQFLLAYSLSRHLFLPPLCIGLFILVFAPRAYSYVFAPFPCSFSLHMFIPVCLFLPVRFRFTWLLLPVRSYGTMHLIVSLHLCVPACLLTPVRSRLTVYSCLFAPYCLLLLVHFCELLFSARLSPSILFLLFVQACSSLPSCLIFCLLLFSSSWLPLLCLSFALACSGLFALSRIFIHTCSFAPVHFHVYPRVCAPFCPPLPLCSFLFLPGCSLPLVHSCSHSRLFISACSHPPFRPHLFILPFSFPPVRSLLFILIYSLPPVRSLLFIPSPIRSLLFVPSCSCPLVPSRLFAPAY